MPFRNGQNVRDAPKQYGNRKSRRIQRRISVSDNPAFTQQSRRSVSGRVNRKSHKIRRRSSAPARPNRKSRKIRRRSSVSRHSDQGSTEEIIDRVRRRRSHKKRKSAAEIIDRESGGRRRSRRRSSVSGNTDRKSRRIRRRSSAPDLSQMHKISGGEMDDICERNTALNRKRAQRHETDQDYRRRSSVGSKPNRKSRKIRRRSSMSHKPERRKVNVGRAPKRRRHSARRSSLKDPKKRRATPWRKPMGLPLDSSARNSRAKVRRGTRKIRRGTRKIRRGTRKRT